VFVIGALDFLELGARQRGAFFGDSILLSQIEQVTLIGRESLDKGYSSRPDDVFAASRKIRCQSASERRRNPRKLGVHKGGGTNA